MAEEKEKKYYYLQYPVTNERYTAFSDADYKKGDFVIAEILFGKDVFSVLSPVDEPSDADTAIEIMRPAQEKEIKFSSEHADEEFKVVKRTKEIADGIQLKLEIVNAHYMPLSSDLIIFFIADGRIDFRELVSRLVKEFKIHIVMRQIGQRDETKSYGICGICGRELCCRKIPSIIKKNLVSMKIVKEQGIIPNAYKLLGLCDRLLCCFAYEEEFYRKEKQHYPSVNDTVRFNNENYSVKEINYISGAVRLENEDSGIISVSRKDMVKSKDGRWFVNDKA